MNASSQKARHIFMEVAELSALEQEAALLRLCGSDTEILAEVRALLVTRPISRTSADAPTMAVDPMPAPVAAQPLPAEESEWRVIPPEHAPVDEKPGANIGPYKLLQLLGEGGFGSVFMAEQERPVQRKVALKIIKLGMDTRQVVARFEQERQALALMDHPNIARVFDAGATSTGRPYFVMELCRGEPITEYCDKNGLSIPDRLTLILQVCQAVHHAHQKGLIHRDLKPSNVLVSNDDGRSVAKVIDFGIAKATANKLAQTTVLTEQAQMIGTPQYMSPEQAEGSLDIDTRTDVYALGVLLYELLIGVTPFDAQSLISAGYAGIQRIIREVDPPKPSTRLSQSGDTIASVAARRHTEPKRLGTIIRGELDWIVMKAMEKERQRRYETANELGMDIERYLSGEAVIAAPPSRSYLLKKFVRRNKGPVIAASLVALVLIGGLIGTSYGLKQAVIARDGETVAKESAQRETARAVLAEAQTKARADELKLVSDFQAGMLAQIDPTRAGEELTADVTAKFNAALAKANIPETERPGQVEAFKGLWSKVNATDAARELIDRTILKPAIKTIDERFKDQPVVDAQLRQVLADRYLDLGLYDAAQPLQARALATRRRQLGDEHPDTLTSINNTGVLLQRQGKLSEAEAHYREAMEKRRRVLGEEQEDTISSIGWLAYLMSAQRRFSEAEPLLREAIDKSRRARGEDHPLTRDGIAEMGGLLSDQGRLAEAEPYLRDALDKRRRVLGEEHRYTLYSISRMGLLLQAEGKLAEAEPYFREAIEKGRRVRGEEHPETLSSISDMGSLLRAQGKLAEAKLYFREALEKRRRVLGDSHADTLISIRRLGLLLRDEGKAAEADPFYREALETTRRLRGEDHADTLAAMNNLGVLLSSMGRYSEAEPYLRDVLERRRRVLGEEDRETLVSINNLGGVLRDQGRLSEAEPYYREALEKSRRVLGEDHATTLIFTTNMGGLLVAEGKWANAVALLAPAESKARKAFPGANAYRLASLLTNLGRARAGLAKDNAEFAAAEANLHEAHAIYAKSPGPSPRDIRDCIRALVEAYAAWESAVPGKGYDAKSAEWNAKLQQSATQTMPMD